MPKPLDPDKMAKEEKGFPSKESLVQEEEIAEQQPEHEQGIVQINLRDRLNDRGVTRASVSVTPSDIRANRRLEHELKTKNLASFIIITGMIICGCVLLSPSIKTSQEQRTWAQSTLTLIIGGALGLLAGRDNSPGS